MLLFEPFPEPMILILLFFFSIPKGTYMLMANQIACLREENFEDAKKFMPERWMRCDERDIHPFATIPFGYGPRNCLGKGTAQRQLWLVTAKVIVIFKHINKYKFLCLKCSYSYHFS